MNIVLVKKTQMHNGQGKIEVFLLRCYMFWLDSDEANITATVKADWDRSYRADSVSWRSDHMHGLHVVQHGPAFLLCLSDFIDFPNLTHEHFHLVITDEAFNPGYCC